MFERILTIILFVMISIFLAELGALIMTFPTYAGWNWGLVPALGVHNVTFTQTFWLSFGMSIVGSTLKGSHVSAKMD